MECIKESIDKAIEDFNNGTGGGKALDVAMKCMEMVKDICDKEIRVKLDEGAYIPKKAHNTDAGFDLRTPTTVYIPPHRYALIDTGVHVEIPHGYVGMVKSKSGLNVKYNLTAEGVIDEGYTGSIMVKMYNHGSSKHCFKAGEKVTQLVIMPIHPCNEMTQVDSLEETERGECGFGSTGK